ncbi:GNAT family N-acetyltransferase [Nocardioides silvaticus]|nr:GNAT family N-acetyltransferase [Nocardioides silvaticus]
MNRHQLDRRRMETARSERLVVAGVTLSIAPLEHGDVATVRAVFDQLGELSRTRRYLSPVPRLTTAAATALADADGFRHHAVVVREGPGRPVALGRLVRTEARRAEPALEVVDDWQGRGLGRLLLRRLLADARELGIASLEGTASADNRPVLRLIRHELCPSEMTYDDGVVSFTAWVPSRAHHTPCGERHIA